MNKSDGLTYIIARASVYRKNIRNDEIMRAEYILLSRLCSKKCLQFDTF